MGFTKIVEVTNVSRATESHSGNSIYLVMFGEEVKVDSELQKYMPQSQNSKPPKVVFENVAQLYFNFDNVVPFKVGSKWKLQISDTGKILLNPIKS